MILRLIDRIETLVRWLYVYGPYALYLRWALARAWKEMDR